MKADITLYMTHNCSRKLREHYQCELSVV